MRFGLLGTGWWATSTQGPGLVAAPEAELVGVWGRDPAKAAVLATRLGVPACDDLDDLLDRVDAVSVALPPDVQPDLAVRAARAGKHLLLDKPLALTVADADRVVAAADEAGVASLLFLTRRFDPAFAAFVADAAGRTWRAARTTMYVPALVPGAVLLDSAWRVEHGPLWDCGPHALAALLPVLGAVTEVGAMRDDTGTTHLLSRHASGVISTTSVSLTTSEAAFSWDTELTGDDGRVVAPPDETPSPELFPLAVRDLVVAGARSDRPHPLDVHAGRETVAVLDAARRSLESGAFTRPVPPRNAR